MPVAFHVNYWDNLGWKDEFASREFTAREYAYSRAWRGDSVYTPCFVRNGREWRLDRRAPAAVANAGELTVRSLGGDRWQVRYAAPEAKAFEAVLVLLGGGIRSRVRAGENGGRTLGHEFVALTLRTAPLVRSPGGVLVAELELRDERAAGMTRVAIAGWVTRPGELAALQSTGGWIRR